MKIVNEVNPDPIAACMALNVCPSSPSARGKVTQLTVTPTSGKQGANFNIFMQFQILNTTGTGQIFFEVNPPGQNNGSPFAGTANFQTLPPGTYTSSFQVSSQPNQDNPFNPGLYSVVGAICESMCGGTSKWAYTLGEANSKFTITP